jgi:hypothetical protein
MLVCELLSWRGGTKGKAPLLSVWHQRLSGPYPQVLLWIGCTGPINERFWAGQRQEKLPFFCERERNLTPIIVCGSVPSHLDLAMEPPTNPDIHTSRNFP